MINLSCVRRKHEGDGSLVEMNDESGREGKRSSHSRPVYIITETETNNTEDNTGTRRHGKNRRPHGKVIKG